MNDEPIPKEWWQLSDLLTRTDEQLERVIELLGRILVRLGDTTIELPEIPAPIIELPDIPAPIIQVDGPIAITLDEPVGVILQDEFLTDRFRITPKTVGSSPTELVAEDTSRRRLVVQNQGDYDLYIGFDKTLTTDNGLLVRPNGLYHGYAYTGPLYGVCASGLSDDVRIVEGSKT